MNTVQQCAEKTAHLGIVAGKAVAVAAAATAAAAETAVAAAVAAVPAAGTRPAGLGRPGGPGSCCRQTANDDFPAQSMKNILLLFAK